MHRFAPQTIVYNDSTGSGRLGYVTLLFEILGVSTVLKHREDIFQAALILQEIISSRSCQGNERVSASSDAIGFAFLRDFISD